MSHPTTDQLTDAALPGTPTDPDVTAHLAGCAHCAAEVDALRRTVGHARDAMTLDVAPPPRPEVWEGILARLGPDAPGEPPAPSPRAGDRALRRPRPRLLGAGLAALVAAAAVLVAVVLASASEPASAPTRIALVAAQPGVEGEVTSGPAGMHVEVLLATPAPAGTGLEVWDMATGTPRSLGTLRAGEGRTHWAGDLAPPEPGAMPPLDVSLEPAGSDPGHSGLSLAHTP